MAFQAALLSLGRIVPSVTIVESNSIYPSIVGSFKPYLGQFSVSTHPRAALVGTIVQQRKQDWGYASGNVPNKARHVEAAASLGWSMWLSCFRTMM